METNHEQQSSGNRSQGCASGAFILIIFLLIGGGLAFWGWNILQEARASASWPTVDGTVLTSSVEHRTDGEGDDIYSPLVVYRYTVNGRTFTNDTIKQLREAYDSRREAEGITSAYPVGIKVNVHYDPDQPERSVLEAGVSAGSYLVLSIGVIFVVLTLLIPPITFFHRRRSIHLSGT